MIVQDHVDHSGKPKVRKPYKSRDKGSMRFMVIDSVTQERRRAKAELNDRLFCRILKTGIRLEGVAVANMVWKTCCALHNMLLEIDGLDEPWDGVLGEHDDHNSDRCVPRGVARNFDSSGIGPGEDIHRGNIDIDTSNDAELNFHEADLNDGEVRTVRHLSQHYFRRKLVDHWAIKVEKKSVLWPCRK